MTERDARFRTVLENRYELLGYLAETAATKPEMVAALDTSRSTVDRAVDDLTEIGCVERENSRYAATATGRVALREHRRYRSTARSIREAAAFVNCLPPDAPLDPCLLDGATATASDARAPDEALQPSVDLFRRAESLRGLAPVVLGFYPSLIEERLETGDLDVEIVAESSVVAALSDLPNADGAALLASPSLAMYETDADLPYALWLMETPEETYAGITAHCDGGVAGVLVNDAADAVEWAEREYRRYLDDARRVSSLDE